MTSSQEQPLRFDQRLGHPKDWRQAARQQVCVFMIGGGLTPLQSMIETLRIGRAVPGTPFWDAIAEMATEL